MANENDLISEATGTATDTPATDDILSAMVGEGKPFKDTEALALGKANSDKHITQIERENAELREAVDKLEASQAQGKTLSDVIEAMNQSKEGEGENQPVLSPEKIAEIVKESIDSRDSLASAKDNRAKVNQAVLAKYAGDRAKALEFLLKAREDTGLTTEQVKELSEKSPNALIKLYGLDKDIQSKSSTSIDSTLNTQTIDTTEGYKGVRNYAYYRAIRKEMGVMKYYNDFDLQKQVQADRDEQGENFLD